MTRNARISGSVIPRHGQLLTLQKMSGGPFSSKKALIAGLVLLCCALVVLTIVATPSPRSTELKVKKSKANAQVWFKQFGWYAGAKPDSEIGLVSSHMKQFNANELYYPLGTFKFDDAVPRFGGGDT